MLDGNYCSEDIIKLLINQVMYKTFNLGLMNSNLRFFFISKKNPQRKSIEDFNKLLFKAGIRSR